MCYFAAVAAAVAAEVVCCCRRGSCRLLRLVFSGRVGSARRAVWQCFRLLQASCGCDGMQHTIRMLQSILHWELSDLKYAACHMSWDAGSMLAISRFAAQTIMLLLLLLLAVCPAGRRPLSC